MPKYSYVISESLGLYVKNIQRGLSKEFEKAVSLLKDSGYSGIEMPLMLDIDVFSNKLMEILESCDMSVSGFTTDHYHSVLNYSLTSSNYALMAKTIDRIMLGLEVSNDFSAPLIIGLLKGRIVDEKSWILLQSSLKILDKKARDTNTRILLEPLNRYEADHLNTISQVYDFIRSLGLENTGILIDSFHMNIEEAKYKDVIEYAKDKISYVRLADNNRGLLGSGHIDFVRIIESLKKAMYTGWFSIGCNSKLSAAEEAKASMEFLKELLE